MTLRPRTSFSLSLDYHTRSLGFTCRCDRHYSNQLSRLSMSPQFNCIRCGWRTLLTLRSQVAWTICETNLRGGFSILRARRTLAHGRPGFSGLVSRALCQLTGPAPQPQSSARLSPPSPTRSLPVTTSHRPIQMINSQDTGDPRVFSNLPAARDLRPPLVTTFD